MHKITEELMTLTNELERVLEEHQVGYPFVGAYAEAVKAGYDHTDWGYPLFAKLFLEETRGWDMTVGFGDGLITHLDKGY